MINHTVNFSFLCSVIVGAPKSNDSNIAEAIGKERGAVYKCPITEPPSTTCTLLKKFDNISKWFYILQIQS